MKKTNNCLSRDMSCGGQRETLFTKAELIESLIGISGPKHILLCHECH